MGEKDAAKRGKDEGRCRKGNTWRAVSPRSNIMPIAAWLEREGSHAIPRGGATAQRTLEEKQVMKKNAHVSNRKDVAGSSKLKLFAEDDNVWDHHRGRPIDEQLPSAVEAEALDRLGRMLREAKWRF